MSGGRSSSIFCGGPSRLATVGGNITIMPYATTKASVSIVTSDILFVLANMHANDQAILAVRHRMISRGSIAGDIIYNKEIFIGFLYFINEIANCVSQNHMIT